MQRTLGYRQLRRGKLLNGYGITGVPPLVVVTPPTLNLALLKVGGVLSACQVAGAYTWPGGPVTETAWAFKVDGVARASSYVIAPADVLIEADVTLTATGLAPGTSVSAIPATVQNTVPHAVDGASTVDVVAGDGSGGATSPGQMAKPGLTSTCTKIVITKAADPIDGGSPITGYDYRYSLDAGVSWSAPVALVSPHTVAGFTPGTLGVLVQTRAKNAVDSNPNNWSPSETINMKIPTLVGMKTYGVPTSAGDKIISLTDLTGGIAAAPAAGDVVVMGMASGSVANRAIAETTGTYTTLFAKMYVNLTEDLNFYGAYKVMGSTPDTTMTVTNTLNSVDSAAVAISVWRYVDPVTPLDVAVVTGSGNNGQPVPGAITAAMLHAAIIVIGAGAAGNAAAADFTSSDLADFQTLSRNNTHSVTIGMGHKDWTSGAFTAAQFGGGNNAAGNARASVALALRPI